MKTGDTLRVSEKQYHTQEKEKISTGKIIAINQSGITILKENGFRESFNIADLICGNKKKELKINDKWEEIKFIQEGGGIHVCKIIRTNNTSSTTNKQRKAKRDNRKAK